jgi:hypothetical protein
MRARSGLLGRVVLGVALGGVLHAGPASAWDRPGAQAPATRGYLMPPSRGALMPPGGSYDPTPPRGWHRPRGHDGYGYQPYGHRPYGYQPYGYQPHGYAPYAPPPGTAVPRQRAQQAPPRGVPALPPLR